MGGFVVEENGVYLHGELIAEAERKEGTRDELLRLGEGIYRWKRHIAVSSEGKQDYGRLVMTLRVMEKPDFYMVPGVNYNGNYWGDGMEPKGIGEGERTWKFASHRAAVPAGMYCQNEDAAFGLWGDMENNSGFSGYMTEDERGGFTLNLQFPEVEEPEVYCARDVYSKEAYRESCLWKDGQIELGAVLVLKERQQEYDYDKFLQAAWDWGRENIEEKKPVETGGSRRTRGRDWTEERVEIRSKEEVWRLGFEFIQSSAFFRENGFAGVCMGLTWQDNQWVQKRDYLEIGWVGQNASLAVSFLYRYAIEARKECLELGLEMLDCWASCAPLPNGLFRCRFDKIQKYGALTDNMEERNDAVNLCSAVEEYLEAYYLLQEFGIERENYRELARNICRFIMEVQQIDGKLGKAWYNNGACADEEGIVGCCLAKALCTAYRYEKDTVYVEAAKRSYHYYYREFIRYGYTTAGALDTYCVDKESAISLLGTALELYRYDKKEEYVEQAVKISNYLATWQYHYNVDYAENTVLGKIGYKTRGGTAVSVQHNHIDCYGLAFYEDWISLSVLTGDNIWHERAEALWSNSLYNISDGTLIIKGQRRPAGSQDEGFLQTRWHTKRGEYFGVSEWLVVWNTAFRLKILRKEYMIRKRELRKEREEDLLND